MCHRTSVAFVIALTTGLAACGGDKGSDGNTTTGNPLSQLTSAVNQMEKMTEGMTAAANRKPVPPVSFKVLIEYLPQKLEGLTADAPKGETTTAGEWQYSQAEANYRSEDGKSARVELFDYAHIPMFYVPFQMIMNMKMGTESTEGYERSTKIGGFPAHEEWRKEGEDNEVTILVADRFVVTTTTHGLGEDSAKKIAESIDLKGLAGKASS